MPEGRYPKINIRTKNDLAKQISGKGLPYPEALKLINKCLVNHDKYWRDSKKSQPDKGKYVRSAVGTPLGVLLKKINEKVLTPYDSMIPGFIFGSISGRSHIQAAFNLLGSRRKRTLLGLDVSRFFEQVYEQRVFDFFYLKCGCKTRAARIIAKICSVPGGAKGSGSETRGLARGFATSPRLAVWTNLDIFLRLKWSADRILKGHDSRVAVFVDDIGITASRVDIPQMEQVFEKARLILASFDSNQHLPINLEKKKIKPFGPGTEHLGVGLGRNKLIWGRKTILNREKIIALLKETTDRVERKILLGKLRAYRLLKKQIRNAGVKKV